VLVVLASTSVSVVVSPLSKETLVARKSERIEHDPIDVDQFVLHKSLDKRAAAIDQSS
jgi:hypothetical protein